jgi:hypothetical protein
MHPLQRQAKLLALADVGQVELAGIQGGAVIGKALLRGRIVQVENLAICTRGQQDTGFLEALANGCQIKRQRTAVDTQARIGLGCVQAAAQPLRPFAAVAAVHRAAGEHVGTGVEIALDGAQQHEHLEARVGAGGVAYQHHGGGVA